MMFTSTPPHRFRFGLRSLFVVVAVVSMVTAWVTYSLNWIRARHEALDHHVMYVTDGMLYPSAPRGLWLFGECGYSNIEPFSIKESNLERASQLFPEARILKGHRWRTEGLEVDLYERKR